MVRVRDSDKSVPTVPYILLDALSFYSVGQVRKEHFIPIPIQRVLDQASLEYNLIGLIAPAKEEPFIEKAVRRARKLFGSETPPTKYPPIGTQVTLSYEEWPKMVKEYGTLIYYLDQPSDPLVSQHVQPRDLCPFPTAMKALRYITETHRVSTYAPQPRAALQPPDMRRAWGTKEFLAKRRTRYSDKFAR